MEEVKDVATPVRNQNDSVFRMLFKETELPWFVRLHGVCRQGAWVREDLSAGSSSEDGNRLLYKAWYFGGFFVAHRAEVMSMSIFEYDREAHLRQAAKSDSMEEFIRGM